MKNKSTKSFLYIGPFGKGSTSWMRINSIQNFLVDYNFHVINTDLINIELNRLSLSVGWRFKFGPMISSYTRYLMKNISEKSYDVVWIEKGVFIEKKVILYLRNKAIKFIHFTPDPAFLYHYSKHFSASLYLYDFCITTKNFEIEYYVNYCCRNLVLCTQGFDATIHKPYVAFESKQFDVSFIGHFEKERAMLIQKIIDQGFSIVLAGINWGKFARKNNRNRNLTYLGSGVYGNDYGRFISNSYFSLGLLSKWIPEGHTTRTFEIPACGTALLTEFNDETKRFFNDSEVVFFNSDEDLLEKLKYLLNHKFELKELSEKGKRCVNEKGFDYDSIMKNILREVEIA
jgi:spore maturation protein CgeB